MTGGTNGLSPIAQLAERQKCPEAPTKKKYLTTDEAWAAARRSEAQSKLPIAPYACAGCGAFHLTRKVDGSDVLTRQEGGKVVTGSQRKRSSNHPVFGKAVVRQTLPEPEEPIVPGNQAARRKVLAGWLYMAGPVTTREVCERMGVSQPTARLDLMALGYVQDHRRAPWHAPAEAAVVPEEPQEPREAAGSGWSDVHADRLPSLLTADLVAVYAAAGFEVRIQVRPRD